VTNRRGDAMIPHEQTNERRRWMLGLGWESGQATIVIRRVVKQGHGGEAGHLSWALYEYIADVQPDGPAAPFRATFGDPRNGIHFNAPEVGQVVKVKFHPRSRQVKFDRSDPGIYRDLGHKKEDKAAVAAAHTAEAQAQFDAVARAAPGTSVPSSSRPPAEGRETASDASSVLSEISAALSEITATTARISVQSSDPTKPSSSARHALAERERAEAERQRGEAARLRATAAELRGEAAPAPDPDPLERLARLADLHERGALTDSEFAAEKAKILEGT
jgi:putative oligomerization/nucleic acid binding protein